MRRMRKGDRVQSRIAARRHVLGTIATKPSRDLLAGRCCVVHWDDGSEQLCLTRDLRRDFRHVLIPVSSLVNVNN